MNARRILFGFLLISSLAAGEPIAQITTLKGETFSQVKILKRFGDEVKFMQADGIKSLKFSDLEESSALALGLREFQNEVAASARRDREQIEREELKKARFQEKRNKFTKNLEKKNRKEVQDWFYLHLLKGPDTVSLKELFGRAPDSSYSDTLIWRGICWNPMTEKMEDLTVETRNYQAGKTIYTLEFLVFRCGGKELEVARADIYWKELNAFFGKSE